MTDIDPLAVECPHCQEPPGSRCGTVNAYSRRPHKARQRLALAMAAHADPALDKWFRMRNPCLICGVKGMPQRHRMVDAIAGHLEAGEYPEEIAGELAVPEDAVKAVAAWAKRWPGAWR